LAFLLLFLGALRRFLFLRALSDHTESSRRKKNSSREKKILPFLYSILSFLSFFFFRSRRRRQSHRPLFLFVSCFWLPATCRGGKLHCPGRRGRRLSGAGERRRAQSFGEKQVYAALFGKNCEFFFFVFFRSSSPSPHSHSLSPWPSSNQSSFFPLQNFFLLLPSPPSSSRSLSPFFPLRAKSPFLVLYPASDSKTKSMADDWEDWEDEGLEPALPGVAAAAAVKPLAAAKKVKRAEESKVLLFVDRFDSI
jgi:hypothetical protein